MSVSALRSQNYLWYLLKHSAAGVKQQLRYYHHSPQTCQDSRRGITFYELIKTFPNGVKKLYHDYLTFKNIEDASKTKQNAWTSFHNNILIPRRQQQQQKRFIRDVQKVMVPVSLAILPMIGNVFILFIAINPRLFLSDQFFTKDQIRFYISNEYRKRKRYFSVCNEDLWYKVTSKKSVQPNDIFQSMNMMREDNAGPVFGNVLPLYKLFQQHFNAHSSSSRPQVLNLAYSTWLSSPILWLQPTILIQKRLNSLAKDIVHDDILLITEKHHLDNCNSLTCSEVLDACFIRNLPCDMDQSSADMRESLTNHLIMFQQVLNDVCKDDIHSSELRKFVLHLPVIRFKARQKTIQ